MIREQRSVRTVLATIWMTLIWLDVARTDAIEPDFIREMQTKAIETNQAEFGHWGYDPQNYKQWSTHSNRLIPVYTFGTLNAPDGVDLRSYQGKQSPYRRDDQLRQIYGRVPSNTLDERAEFLDQTNLFQLQQAAFLSGKKFIFLVIFDGMDWQTTWAAAIYESGRTATTDQQADRTETRHTSSRLILPYREGRGTGLHFQDYTANGTTQFGFICTSPHNQGTRVNVDKQTVLNPGGTMFGGYNIDRGGPNPWTSGSDLLYLISKSEDGPFRHAYTDSSSSATSMTAGIKTYNNAVNVDYAGQQVSTIAHWAQTRGYSIGAVSSVPISHATPAAAYAHNVHRDDYQDLTRDLLGLPSISHPTEPLSGMDVVIGGGFGDIRMKDGGKKENETPDEGSNFVPGNAYLTDADLRAIDIKNGGRYVTSLRMPGVNGQQELNSKAIQAAREKQRLLGFYGIGKYSGHLPFATADGDFRPTIGKSSKAEQYGPEDLVENPTLANMTEAAIMVLSQNPKGFWLMVEPGDVDWANHDNNIDNSIGAVFSGDDAVKTITEWVEKHSNWNESLLIVTADHGHYLVLENPELLLQPKD